MKSRIDKLEYIFEIKFNNKIYYKNNKPHRDNDLPAIIWKDGSRVWYENGKSHRDNGKPSHIYSDGYMEWYKDDMYIKSNYNEI